MIFTQVTNQPLSLAQAQEFIADHTCGGQDYFLGTVRDHNEGKVVSSLEYQCYEKMCDKLLIKFAEEAIKEFSVKKVFLAHRFGHLQIKDIAVLVATSGHHRDECFKATRYLIEEIKRQLPVWKKEHYVGEVAQWVQCHHHHHHL